MPRLTRMQQRSMAPLLAMQSRLRNCRAPPPLTCFGIQVVRLLQSHAGPSQTASRHHRQVQPALRWLVPTRWAARTSKASEASTANGKISWGLRMRAPHCRTEEGIPRSIRMPLHLYARLRAPLLRSPCRRPPLPHAGAILQGRQASHSSRGASHQKHQHCHLLRMMGRH